MSMFFMADIKAVGMGFVIVAFDAFNTVMRGL